MIPIARPVLDDAEVEAARRVILSGWVTQGPAVSAFEQAFAGYVGASYACAVSSGTTALHMALITLGVKPGDEVITVSHSFIATANVVRYCGADPVFVDIDPLTFNMDPALIERAITPRTRAILCVHQIGMPCDLSAIMAIARRYNLLVVEDAACAIGGEISVDGKWQKIGRPYGDIACFSFHPRKLLTTGDGGMLTTANLEWDRQFRLLRHHGMSISDTARHSANDVIIESYVSLGFNYRMTDIQAAIGEVQLGRLEETVRHRRELVGRYQQLLGHITGLGLPHQPEWARSNWQSYCVRLPPRVDQTSVMRSMLQAGVATRPGIMCAHLEPAYSGLPLPFALPESERARNTCILLPLFHQMTDEEQQTVARVLEQSLS
jgi:perosamine synthetase